MCLRLGARSASAKQLVDLLFVFGEYELGFAVAQKVGGFLIEHVAIKTKAHGADGVDCDLG